MKNTTIKKLEARVGELEDIISEKGIGSNYVRKAKRIQRDINIGLLAGTVAAVGVAAWMLLSSGDK